MEHKTIEAFKTRRSIRKYTEEKLSPEQIETLVQVALSSPSAKNFQPWHLTVVKDTELVAEWEQEIVQYFVDIGDTKTVEWNAKRNNKIFYDAPVVFVISMEPDKGLDVGIMAQSIAVAAKSMGLGSVILGFPRVVFSGDNAEKWQERLKFPKDYTYGISVAVGYAAESGRHREIDKSKVSYVE